MKINPINNTKISNSQIQNTNFRMKIKSTELLEKGFELAKNNIERSEVKSINCAKMFYDNINLIQLSKDAKEVSFEIEKDANKAFAIADGKIVSEYSYPGKYNLGYISAQIVKQFAEKLRVDRPVTLLDKFKLNMEIAYKDYQEAFDTYKIHLEAVLKDLKDNL